MACYFYKVSETLCPHGNPIHCRNLWVLQNFEIIEAAVFHSNWEEEERKKERKKKANYSKMLVTFMTSTQYEAQKYTS
jgi:hypothetical protein